MATIRLRLMRADDGLAAPDYASAVARYIAEARALADRLLNQCAETGRHYLFVEVDYQEGALDLALQGSNARGVLTIFRNDAPVPGSTVSVSFPDQRLEQ